MSVIVLGDGILSATPLAVTAGVMHLKMYSLKIKGRKFLPCLHCANAIFFRIFNFVKICFRFLDQLKGQ